MIAAEERRAEASTRMRRMDYDDLAHHEEGEPDPEAADER
jgi:hypothetical protein